MIAAAPVLAVDLFEAHEIGAWVVVVANALVGLWALGAYQWPRLRHPSLWWATIAAEVTIFVEVALGVALMNVEDIEPPELHVLYGFSAIIAVGIVYSYKMSSPWVRDRLHLVYGATGLFLMGLGIRAMLLHL